MKKIKKAAKQNKDVGPETKDVGPASRAPAVARAATILRVLSSARSGLGVTDIARRVGMVPSTCLHVLRALVDEGFIAFDNKKKTYRTAVGLLTLVRDSMASSEFPKAVRPVLDDLAKRFNATVIAAELDSRERMVVVALARPDNLVSLHVNVGSRVPSLLSATGRCVAAASNLSRNELKKRFEQLKWERAPQFDDWYAEVERARVEGTAVDPGNTFRGLTIVSSLLPIGIDRIHRAIVLVGFEHYMHERKVREIKTALIEAGREVAARLN